MAPDELNNKAETYPVRENRYLRIIGVICIALALAALFYLSEQVELNSWRQYHSLWQWVPVALLYFCGANLLVLGLIVLLTGFGDLSLLTTAKARKGLLVKLAGANLLIVTFGLMVLHDAESLEESWVHSVAYFIALALFVVAARAGVVLIRRGWKYDAIGAEKLLEQDTRPPVVYIRSFKDDRQIILASGIRRWLSIVFAWATAISAEQELAMIMNRVGPVVAIGKPGEPLPELGAARLYVSDDVWQEKITDMMKQSRLVVIRLGPTANLWWEIDQAVKLLPLRRLLVVSLQSIGSMNSFGKEFEERFGRPEMPLREKSPLLRLMRFTTPLTGDMGAVVYFDQNAKPHAEPIQFFFSWLGFIMLPYRPYWEPLKSAFQHVFKQLDLPWVDQRSRTTAALLALFVGWFGFHHFYLGNRRRGFYYLAFCWTMVPLILAWVDTIRLALANEREFQEKFVRHPA
jgi:hypothetical protein